jgi:hypothetical protein
LATASHADVLSDPGGVICRQAAGVSRVLEVERKSSGGMIVRISGKDILQGRVPGARSLEATFDLANCQPTPQGHWLDANLFTCIGPAEPQIRDANGENLPMPTAFVRVVLKTYVNTFFLKRRNEYRYSLQIVGANTKLYDAGVFYPDNGGGSCRLMRHPEIDE